jgi:hypothetical protein
MDNEWEKRPSDEPGRFFYRKEKGRITVCLEPFTHYKNGEPCRLKDTWIFYRDSWGFREGEFNTAEEAMAAADVSVHPRLKPNAVIST